MRRGFRLKLIGLMIAAGALAAVFVRSVSADHLRNVRLNRILYVGVASDFPPFASVSPEGAIEGIDIDLVGRIAADIGVGGEVVDIAFAGLVDSLLAGQVDLIAGALPVEDGLSSVLDYTNVYYQGKFGLLGIPGGLDASAFTADDLGWIRLGVQRGTVQAQFARSYWIGSGRIPPAQLQVFDSRDEAVEALNWGEIDYFLTTEEVYKRRYELSGAYTWITGDFATVRFAFAAPEGSTLVPEINRILSVLSADGTAQQFANARMSEAWPETAVDFSRGSPLSDVRAGRSCTFAARFSGDETLPDGETVESGAALEKRWRVMNIGSCAWESGTALVPITDAETFPVVPFAGVRPGEVVTIALPFTAPTAHGQYLARFRLSAPDGSDFGQILRLRLTVR